MSMNKKRLILIFSVVIIFMICLYFLNLRFDRLSRYPYDDDYARQQMDEYLSDRDIEYLIEYSIAPNNFIDYISYPGFSVYHLDYYKELDELLNSKVDESGKQIIIKNDEEIVRDIELLIQNNCDVSRGITLLQGMPIEEILVYFESMSKDNGN